MDFNLFTPTKLLFGRGKLNELGNQKLPGKKALLLISSGKSVKVNGTLDRVTAQLEKAGITYTICNNIHENPSKEVVMEAAACAKENGCDFILALGGGAVLDAAVAVAAMATNPGDLWDYVCGGTGKAQPLQHPGLPIVTIATTSGTGSEINCWGVISKYAAFRAHYFQVVPAMEATNVLECHILRVIEDTFSTVVLFCNGNRTGEHASEVLTYELPKEEWQALKNTETLYLKMPPEQIIWLEK